MFHFFYKPPPCCIGLKQFAGVSLVIAVEQSQRREASADCFALHDDDDDDHPVLLTLMQHRRTWQ